MKLNEAVRKGIMKSAWDGVDDPFGPEYLAEQQTNEMRERMRAEANRRQDELNARIAAKRMDDAMAELEQLEGFGGF